ncbi:MAG: baseplate J/gp47 family protein [Deltaproteobacteria bacterium]|nr:baseplate J/gp47 family protein [Deltaproteobacteria bacterium]
MLSYYQDRVAAEAFLETASQRHSLRQHGVLLGYEVYDGEAARTVLSVDPTFSGYVPIGLSVKMPGRPEEPPVVFHTLERVRVRPENATHRLVPAAWPGATEAKVPAGATEILLYGHDTRLDPGTRLAFVTEGAPTQVVTLEAITRLRAAGWVADPSDPPPVVPAEVTRVQWREPLAQALLPWGQTRLSLHANLVDAGHGEFRRAWLGTDAWLANQSVDREDVVITPTRRNHTAVRVRRGTTDVVHLRALHVPEGPVVFTRDSQGGLRPALEVEVGGEVWTRVEHLHRSLSHHRHYVASADTDGRMWLEFGDGVHGREVEIDQATGLPLHPVVLRYRVGDPVAGNCARSTLTEEIGVQPATVEAKNERDALGALTGVTNVVPGAGGREAESADAIRHNIPVQLKKAPLQRAVSLEDYAEVAGQVEGVDRAYAMNLGGVFNTVAIVVDPQGRAGLSEALERAVWSRIDATRMAGREHIVLEPTYVPLEVELVVCAAPGVVRADLRAEVLRALRPGPGPKQGWFHPDRISFSEPMEIGDLLAFVQGIEGVHAVKVLRFRRLLVTADPAVVPSIVPSGAQVLRLDADADLPENGTLVVRVVGLDEVDVTSFSIEPPQGVAGVC